MPNHGTTLKLLQPLYGKIHASISGVTDGTIQSRDYREPVPECAGANQDGASESGYGLRQ